MPLQSQRKINAMFVWQQLELAAHREQMLSAKDLAGDLSMAYMGPVMRLALKDCYAFCKKHHGEVPDLTTLLSYEKVSDSKWFWDLHLAELEDPADAEEPAVFMSMAQKECFEFYASLGE